MEKIIASEICVKTIWIGAMTWAEPKYSNSNLGDSLGEKRMIGFSNHCDYKYE